MSQRLSSVLSHNATAVFNSAEKQVLPELRGSLNRLLLLAHAVYFSFCVLIKFSNIFIKGVIPMSKIVSTKKKAPLKKKSPKKAALKKIVLKKASAKKPAAKKSPAKKAVTERTSVRKASKNKMASKKPVQKKPGSKVSTAKKTAAPKKAAAKIVHKKAKPQRAIKKTVPKAGPQKTALKTPLTKPVKIAAKKSPSLKKSTKKPAADIIPAPAKIMRAVTPATEKTFPERHVFPIKTPKVHSLRSVVARLSRAQRPRVSRPAENIAALARTALPNVLGAKLPFMKKIRHI